MKPNDHVEQILQHGSEHICIRYFPETGLIYMRRIDRQGNTIPHSQELLSVGDYPGFDCLHDGIGWHPSLPIQLLRIYDEKREGDTLPYFIQDWYAKGRSLV